MFPNNFSMETTVLEFEELSLSQLYQLLRLRSQVFVVEQDCVYQDIDNHDQEALHILGFKDNLLVAYTRVFDPETYTTEASIGRVVVHPDYRKQNLGVEIMRASINVLKSRAHKRISISAQCYLDQFYKDLGFESTGKKYLEDGIPHQEMILELNT